MIWFHRPFKKQPWMKRVPTRPGRLKNAKCKKCDLYMNTLHTERHSSSHMILLWTFHGQQSIEDLHRDIFSGRRSKSAADTTACEQIFHPAVWCTLCILTILLLRCIETSCMCHKGLEPASFMCFFQKVSYLTVSFYRCASLLSACTLC